MADEYSRCKDCKHINSNETNGYKWYCECYGTYEDPDEYKKCKNYKE